MFPPTVCGLPIHFLNDIFLKAKSFNFDEAQFNMFLFMANDFCVCVR